MAGRVLVVDDDHRLRTSLRHFLLEQGYEVGEAGDSGEALERLTSSTPDLTILDYALPDGNALDLLPQIKAIAPDVPVVVLTGHGTIDLAVRSMRQGAEYFVTKPIDFEALGQLLTNILSLRHRTQPELPDDDSLDPFLGISPAIRSLREQAAKLIDVKRPVLVVGETGSGKGVLARWLHARNRGAKAFVQLNCAGLSSEFLESELFGHTRGAFTGAVSAKVGLFEVADGGTLFLDEIGDMDVGVQAKLLTVLEDRRFRRLGDTRERRTDVALIAATHRDPYRLAQEGRFRWDLYFRIATLTLQIPSLRQRPQDIGPIAEVLLATICQELGRARPALAPSTLDVLRTHPWPGNIRELRNVLERAMLFAGELDTLQPANLELAPAPPLAPTDTEQLALDSSPPPAQPPVSVDAEDLSLEAMEQRHIERVLDMSDGHVGRAAARLGVPRSTLYNKLKRYRKRTRETPKPTA